MAPVFRTMIEQAIQSTKCIPSYIEFELCKITKIINNVVQKLNSWIVSSSFAYSTESKLTCILIHDKEDVSIIEKQQINFNILFW